jgi:ABC-2 type transport system permease protein
MRLISDTWMLAMRALREAYRLPANDATNIFIPIFFYAVTVGALGQVAADAFGVVDYKGFAVPVAVLQGSAAMASGAGLAMTLDIQSGYFEKLILTSTPRYAIVLGRMVAEAIKATVLALVIVIIALVVGSGFETGVLGIIVLLGAAGFFALAYAGFGMAIALKTGSPQAAQAGFIIFFPLLFLAPTFAPTEVFARWLDIAATFNPVTYLLEGMRGLIIADWDIAQLARGGAAVAGIGIVTFTLTAMALKGRAVQ